MPEMILWSRSHTSPVGTRFIKMRIARGINTGRSNTGKLQAPTRTIVKSIRWRSFCQRLCVKCQYLCVTSVRVYAWKSRLARISASAFMRKQCQRLCVKILLEGCQRLCVEKHEGRRRANPLMSVFLRPRACKQHPKECRHDR
jgi:hypothetical protein